MFKNFALFRFTSKLVQASLFLVLVILIFPVLTYQLIFEAWGQYKEGKARKSNRRNNELSIEDLAEKLTLDEIEAREYIYDPLNAVPHLPFGHNHSIWHNFKYHLDEDDELWSFSAILENVQNQKEKQSGYAIVHAGHIKLCYYTERYVLLEQNEVAQNRYPLRWWQFSKYDVS